MSDRAGPALWEAILDNHALPFDPATLQAVVRDQRRWTRAWLYPAARLFSRLAVAAIVLGKRLLPFQFTAHRLMDRLCVWFLRRFVAPEAGALLIRHFVIETNLLNFLIANSAGAGKLPPVTLVPTTLRQLGDHAVIEHDINVYAVLIALGRTGHGGRPAALDFSMLTVPPIDAEPGTRRFLRLDIQTALCLMNIPFALCLTSSEYRRAVHSLRLDEPLMALLSAATGDPSFLAWRPAGTAIRVDSTMDVPRAVYEHAVYCEHAHARLLELSQQ
ncbi:DUF6999 family protein [Longispora albida]|uniref:DUF6999 family protein n=1 Tax=Longispora albida TaxID=203523 RepID=UPI0003763F64|nr:hypothetical protein [Longispora albida]